MYETERSLVGNLGVRFFNIVLFCTIDWTSLAQRIDKRLILQQLQFSLILNLYNSRYGNKVKKIDVITTANKSNIDSQASALVIKF